MAVLVERADLASLAQTRMIERVVDPELLRVAHPVDEVRDDFVAVGDGVRRRVDRDGVERVSVAVEVDASEIGLAADIAEDRRGHASVLQAEKALGRNHGATAVGFGMLVIRLEGEGETLRKRQLRVQVKPEDVGRIATVSKVTGGGETTLGIRRVLHARVRGRGPARRRRQHIRRRRIGKGRERQVVELLPAVLDVECVERDEVVALERLVDLGVELSSVDARGRVVGIVIPLVAGGDKGARSIRGERAGIEDAERALEPEGADRHLHAAAHFSVRIAQHVIDGAAGRRRGGAVEVGRARADIDFADQLGVELLLRIEGVIARVIHWDAVERLADPARVEIREW